MPQDDDAAPLDHLDSLELLIPLDYVYRRRGASEDQELTIGLAGKVVASTTSEC